MSEKNLDGTTIGAVIAVATGVLTAGVSIIMATSSESYDLMDAQSSLPSVELPPEPIAPPPDTPTPAPAPAPAPSEEVAAPPASAPTTSALADNSATVFAEILAYQDSTLTFEATFPPGARADPVLSGLRQEASDFLNNMKSNAQMAYSADIADGLDPNPWDVNITWRETARAGDIVSFAGDSYIYTGGAHGNVEFETLIANAGTGDRISFNDMFLPRRSPSPAFVIALCEGLKAEKQARISEATIYGEPIVCIGEGANAGAETPIVALTASSEAEKFGGARIYYPPYAVGAYAEGPYVVTVPQGVFASDLRPEYAALFGGDPIAAD